MSAAERNRLRRRAVGIARAVKELFAGGERVAEPIISNGVAYVDPHAIRDPASKLMRARQLDAEALARAALHAAALHTSGGTPT